MTNKEFKTFVASSSLDDLLEYLLSHGLEVDFMRDSGSVYCLLEGFGGDAPTALEACRKAIMEHEVFDKMLFAELAANAPSKATS